MLYRESVWPRPSNVLPTDHDFTTGISCKVRRSPNKYWTRKLVNITNIHQRELFARGYVPVLYFLLGGCELRASSFEFDGRRLCSKNTHVLQRESVWAGRPRLNAMGGVQQTGISQSDRDLLKQKVAMVSWALQHRAAATCGDPLFQYKQGDDCFKNPPFENPPPQAFYENCEMLVNVAVLGPSVVNF